VINPQSPQRWRALHRLRPDARHRPSRPAKGLAWLTLFLAATAGATEPTEYAECRASRTESEIYECMQEQLKVADAELNASYKSLVAQYRDNGAPAGGKTESQDSYLQEAQIAWIKLRDASCQFETYDSIMGNGFGTIHTACLLKHTRERTQYLKWYIDHP